MESRNHPAPHHERAPRPRWRAVIRTQRIERGLGRWGRELYDALFTAEENRALLSQLLDGPEPRTMTIATRDPALLRLPWELMVDDAGSLAQRLSVRRQLEEPETTAPRPAQLPLRILYIVSRPADAGFIDPRLTAKALLDALDPLGASVRVDFCRPRPLWDLEADKPVVNLHLDTGLSSLTSMPDGRTLAAGDVSGTVHFLWLEGLAT